MEGWQKRMKHHDVDVVGKLVRRWQRKDEIITFMSTSHICYDGGREGG